MAATTVEILWLIALLIDLNVQVFKLMELFFDSISAIHMTKNPLLRERSKYIAIDCHFIREKVYLGIIQPQYLHSKQQVVDLFTKALHPA